jgi:photosystem II stability/assembly factor-like uncharacterized protein
MMKRKLNQAIPAIILIFVFLLVGCSGKTAELLEVQTNQPGQEPPEMQTNQSDQEPPEMQTNQSDQEPPEIPANNSQWSIVLDTEIPHSTNIEGFLNEEYGITVGFGGEIHYSIDSGKTWPQGENSSLCRICLDIVDENLAWCGGMGNAVRVTKDGGKTWTEVSDVDLGGGHSNIDFIDDKTGWIASLTKCAATNDGGATWTELILPEEVKGIASICLSSPQDAYLLTLNGFFFTSSDGGATWSKQDLDLDKYQIYDSRQKLGLNKTNIAVADISFTDKGNGTIILTGIEPGKGYKVWCLTTTDCGANWTAELLDPIEGFSPVKVFLSGEGKYLTLGSMSKRLVVLKREG